MAWRTRKPTLVVNPEEDDVFAGFAQMLVDHGARSIDELERRLRTSYPNAAVHARELAAEAVLIFYVYRDGHWVDSRDPSTIDHYRGRHESTR